MSIEEQPTCHSYVIFLWGFSSLKTLEVWNFEGKVFWWYDRYYITQSQKS